MTGKAIGYARTGSAEEDGSAQIKVLKKAGCTEIFIDIGVSGNALDRLGLKQVLETLESGDTLKVDRLDRIAHSVAAFSEFRKSLGERKIHIVILNAGIETTPALAEAAMKLMRTKAKSELN